MIPRHFWMGMGWRLVGLRGYIECDGKGQGVVEGKG